VRDGTVTGSLMTCLIEKKNYDDMNEKCYAGIEHYQLVITPHSVFLCLPTYAYILFCFFGINTECEFEG